jgi:hypothetical protein
MPSESQEAQLSSTLKYRCQKAYESYFTPTTTDSACQEYAIIKVSLKVKKLGVWWVFGDIADFKLTQQLHTDNARLMEAIKGTAKRVRLMIPPEGYSAYNKPKTSSGFVPSGRSSSSSNANSEN